MSPVPDEPRNPPPMSSRPSRLARFLRPLFAPGPVSGALMGATVAALNPGGTGLGGLLIGWLYGLVVGTSIRSARVAPPAYPVVGLLLGPLPFALLMPRDASGDQRGILVVGMIAGVVLGCVQWGHAAWLRSTPPGAGPTPGEPPA